MLLEGGSHSAIGFLGGARHARSRTQISFSVSESKYLLFDALLAARFTRTPLILIFLFLKHQSTQCQAWQLHANAALSVSLFRSPAKRNTCGFARGTNLSRGTATLCDVQFAMLRLPAHPELDHCRDNATVRILCAILSSLAPLAASASKRSTGRVCRQSW